MRWLKTLVIGMGIVIVIGLTVVIVEVAQRAGEPAKTAASGPTPPAPPIFGTSSIAPAATAPASVLGDRSIAIPAGAIAEDMTMDRDRLAVRLRLADGSAAFLILDLATGRKLGMFTLDSRPRKP